MQRAPRVAGRPERGEWVGWVGVEGGRKKRCGGRESPAATAQAGAKDGRGDEPPVRGGQRLPCRGRQALPCVRACA